MGEHYSDAELIFYTSLTIVIAVVGLAVTLGLATFEQIHHAIGSFIDWFYSTF